MQAYKRFILLWFLFLLTICLYFFQLTGKSKKFKSKESKNNGPKKLPSFIDDWEQINEIGRPPTPKSYDLRLHNSLYVSYKKTNKNCRMETCFDASRCDKNFHVFVYPLSELDSNGLMTSSRSILYQKMLDIILESRYYTDDYTKACVFVVAIDTLDRDPLSPDYIRNIPVKMQRLKHWNGGRNHIIFNLYSGSWPDYYEDDLGFYTGDAILAKASMSVTNMRPGFDISFPLFHKKHPERGGESGFVRSNTFPITKKYKLAFKGKRYVLGIGSETRNSIFHLHNGKDTIIVTTCKHGKNWKDAQDERCIVDNSLYEKYDYSELLKNSTFCLVPRGRRLGSYRFLEALQAGCIPVLLSNNWALPFNEVIDWNKAVIWADERLLFQVPEIINSVSETKLFALRQQTQILWEQYFNTIEKIVFVTFEIIKERLPMLQSRNGIIWNTSPGALVSQHSFTGNLHFNLPFNYHLLGKKPGTNFTAVIFSQQSTFHTLLNRLVRNLSASKYLSQIVVNSCVESGGKSGYQTIAGTQILISSGNGCRRFESLPFIKTEAVLSLDDDVVLSTDEIDFAFNVWQSFPERIVGFPARSHYWDSNKDSWLYSSKWTNDYSIVLTGAAFYHQYYNTLYTTWLSPLLIKTVEQSHNCEDILMNCLVSHVTRHPPIKVSQRKHYKEQGINGMPKSPWNDPDHFMQRQTCLNTFVALFGYMPLLQSSVRLDPILFKDPVSNFRKKYKQIELISN
ncbi:exostosin-1 isoform X1 [Daktulosphaira vitifoliae]|uniref:exostosin-1 isoform X1 n=1 Tax=Daktulosphaira vitifoliae TaxID=58002 RepID=UPI0021AAA4CA|nr:exostosin-1 isoform X1 [Daktulosphaira vitifoliae]